VMTQIFDSSANAFKQSARNNKAIVNNFIESSP
jgi:hypothetical protein